MKWTSNKRLMTTRDLTGQCSDSRDSAEIEGAWYGTTNCQNLFCQQRLWEIKMLSLSHRDIAQTRQLIFSSRNWHFHCSAVDASELVSISEGRWACQPIYIKLCQRLGRCSEYNSWKCIQSVYKVSPNINFKKVQLVLKHSILSIFLNFLR